jgi:hypothetical protein
MRPTLMRPTLLLVHAAREKSAVHREKMSGDEARCLRCEKDA